MTTPIILRMANPPKKPACSVITGVGKIKVSKIQTPFLRELQAVFNSKKVKKWEMSMAIEIIPEKGFLPGTVVTFGGVENAVIADTVQRYNDYETVVEVLFTSYSDDPFSVDPRDFIGKTIIESHDHKMDSLIQKQ